MYDEKKALRLSEILRIGLVGVGFYLIIYYFGSRQYIAGSFWIFLVAVNAGLMIHDSQKRGKINESTRKITEEKIRTRTKNKSKT